MVLRQRGYLSKISLGERVARLPVLRFESDYQYKPDAHVL